MTLKDRIHDEMVEPYHEPDADKLVQACKSIVGIEPDSFQVKHMWRFDELSPDDKVIAHLLAAWAASVIREVSGTAPVTDLLELDGVDESVLEELEGDWIGRHGGYAWLNNESLSDAVDRLIEECHGGEE